MTRRSYDVINECVLSVLHSPFLFKFELVANILKWGDITLKKKNQMWCFFENIRRPGYRGPLFLVAPFPGWGLLAPLPPGRAAPLPPSVFTLPTFLIYVTDFVLKALGSEIPDVVEGNSWSLLGAPFPGLVLLLLLLFLHGLLLGTRWQIHGVHVPALLCPLPPSLI